MEASELRRMASEKCPTRFVDSRVLSSDTSSTLLSLAFKLTRSSKLPAKEREQETGSQ